MLQGEFSHRDNQGNEGHLKAGDIQWVMARHGIVHEEMPIQNDEVVRGFQLWVNSPSGQKLIAPKYQDVVSARIPEVSLGAGLVRVLAGSYQGFDGPADDMAIERDCFNLHLDQDGYFGHTIATGKTA